MVAEDPEHDLLTIAETARALKVSTVTIHRWLKQDRLPSYHLGSALHTYPPLRPRRRAQAGWKIEDRWARGGWA